MLRMILWWAKINKLKQHLQNLAVPFILRECVLLQSFRVCPECVCLQAHIVCPSEGETREAYRVYSVTRSMLWQFDGDNEHEILFHGIYDDLSVMKYFNLIQNMPQGAILQNNKMKLLQICRTEFYSCHLCESTSPRLLADCSSPGMVTISFRRFSPLPGDHWLADADDSDDESNKITVWSRWQFHSRKQRPCSVYFANNHICQVDLSSAPAPPTIYSPSGTLPPTTPSARGTWSCSWWWEPRWTTWRRRRRTWKQPRCWVWTSQGGSCSGGWSRRRPARRRCSSNSLVSARRRRRRGSLRRVVRGSVRVMVGSLQNLFPRAASTEDRASHLWYFWLCS